MEVQTARLVYTQSARVKNLVSKLHVNAHLFNNLFGGVHHLQPSDENERFMQHGVDVELTDTKGPNDTARYAIDIWPGHDATERGLWIPKHRVHLVTSVADVSIQAFDDDGVPQPLEVGPGVAARKALKLLVGTTMDYVQIAQEQRAINGGVAIQTEQVHVATSAPGLLDPAATT